MSDQIQTIGVQKIGKLPSEPVFILWAKLTNEQLQAIVDEASQKGSSVNLNIPATPETINFIFDNIFKCQRCGSCCQGLFPNATEAQIREAIPVSDEDINGIANLLKVRPRRIKRLCQANSQGGLSLPVPCPYYSNAPKPGCSVYSGRPLTCRLYPLYSVYPIYSELAYGLNQKPNEKPLLSLDLKCPKAKEAALRIFELMRNVKRTE